MLKIAITGNIASGKSQLEKLIAAKGYKVFDSDDIAHDLIFKDEEVIQGIKKAFKKYDILHEDGSISRAKLGKIVFKDKSLLTKLESIIHPVIKHKIASFLNGGKHEKAIFISVPLLFEKNFRELFDIVILVKADEGVRLKRLMDKGDFDIEHAKERMAAQMSQDKKIVLSDYVIDNNSTVKKMEAQLTAILKKLNLA